MAFSIIPTVFMPLSFLSYASILGILSTIMIIACIVIDGLSKRESPGSLWQPASTDLGVKDATKLGISFGLFMAGVSN
jgi:solute carrier family 32 (vesicular inhibitory amino acid transporter)